MCEYLFIFRCMFLCYSVFVKSCSKLNEDIIICTKSHKISMACSSTLTPSLHYTHCHPKTTSWLPKEPQLWKSKMRHSTLLSHLIIFNSSIYYRNIISSTASISSVLTFYGVENNPLHKRQNSKVIQDSSLGKKA